MSSSMISQSPYMKLVNSWKSCELCDLHKCRTKVVMARGKIPCDVAIVAEAPGSVEDLWGVPLIGPAGEELDSWIDKAQAGLSKPLKVGYMNLVGCIPNDDNPKRKTVEPLPAEIQACYPRLERLLAICKPKLVVCVGKLAEKVADAKGWSEWAKVVDIIHPAAWLREPDKHKQKKQLAMITLEDAFEELSNVQE